MDKQLRSILIGLAVVTLLAFALGLVVGRIARKPAKASSTETSLKLAVKISAPQQNNRPTVKPSGGFILRDASLAMLPQDESLTPHGGSAATPRVSNRHSRGFLILGGNFRYDTTS
jgi:hypothetical protein